MIACNLLSGPNTEQDGSNMTKNIGFISTRFAGTDGVSMEASKWAHVLTEAGYHCFWLAGELEHDDECCKLVPEAHFKHENNQWLNDRIFGRKGVKPM
jgi:mannosylglucosylglycerate synthase